MRINAPASADFAGFAYKNLAPINAPQQQLHGGDHRQPQSNEMKEISQQQRKLNNNLNRKRPMLIDSDDEENTLASKPEVVNDDDGWISARNPLTIDERERAQYQYQAKAERRKSSKAIARKRVLTDEDADCEDYDDDGVDTWGTNGAVEEDNLLDEGSTPAEYVRKNKGVTKLLRVAEAVKKPPNAAPKPAKQQRRVEIEIDDDDNDSDDGWEEAVDRITLEEEAKRILSNCLDISASLRQSLRSWGAGLTESAASVKSIDQDGAGNNNCVNLVSITGSCADEIVTDDDLFYICRGLTLKPYQLVGVNWLKLLHVNKINGVLADDMGLGKTVQSIAFLAWLSTKNKTENHKRPHLIVVPASVLSNWENEFARFCPSFDVRTYHGTQGERYHMRSSLKGDIERGRVDVVLSTYTVFERESGKDDRKFLCSIAFEYALLDEAHCLKNAGSQRYRNLLQLNSRRKLLLSGTPVQNNPSELLAMLAFLMPQTFRKQDCETLVQVFSWDKASTKDDHQNSINSTNQAPIKQLRGMLAPFVLRRLKRDVLDQLVAKETKVVYVSMTESQKKLYDDILLGYAQRKERLRVRHEAEAAHAKMLDGARKIKRPALAASSSAIASTSTGNSTSTGLTVTSSISAAVSLPLVVDLSSPIQTKAEPPLVHDAQLQHHVTIALGRSTEDVVEVVEGEEAAEDADFLANEPAIKELTATEAKHLFTALRKAAYHPLLLRNRYNDPKVVDAIANVAYYNGFFGSQCDLKRVQDELVEFSDYDLHQLCMEYPDPLIKYELPSDALYDSPKMCELRELIPRLRSQGHRILIFSQWTRMLDLLEALMINLGMGFFRLDGSTPIKERQTMIDSFNAAGKTRIARERVSGDTDCDSGVYEVGSSDQCEEESEEDEGIHVFLLSTKAGGLGINLTSADTVIMHDLDFNPENDRQAEDRCHRIGQTKAVTVYKLVTSDSVDQDIYELGERKTKLSSAVLADDHGRGEMREMEPLDVSATPGAHEGLGDKKQQHMGGGSSKKKKKLVDEDDDEGGLDVGAIGRILQKALQRTNATKSTLAVG